MKITHTIILALCTAFTCQARFFTPVVEDWGELEAIVGQAREASAHFAPGVIFRFTTGNGLLGVGEGIEKALAKTVAPQTAFGVPCWTMFVAETDGWLDYYVNDVLIYSIPAPPCNAQAGLCAACDDHPFLLRVAGLAKWFMERSPERMEYEYTLVPADLLGDYWFNRAEEARMEREMRELMAPVQLRNNGVDEFCITEFTVGETSVWFRAEWPAGEIFPDEEIDVLYHPTLTFDWIDEEEVFDTWWYGGSFLVDTNQTWVVFEVMLDDLVGLNQEGINSGFFKLRISDLHGVLNEDDGDWEEIDPHMDDPVDTGDVEGALLLGGGWQEYYELEESFDVVPGQLYVVTIYISHFENSYWLGGSYNDVVTWDISLPDGRNLSGSQNVNESYTEWLVTQGADFWIDPLPYHVAEIAIFKAPEQMAARAGGFQPLAMVEQPEVTVRLTMSCDGEEPRINALMFNKYPFKLLQENKPNIDRAASSTDHGVRGWHEIGSSTEAIETYAYITGEPSPPQLYACLDYMYASEMIEWRMTLTPERDERKPMDTREYPAGGGYFPPSPGGVFWDITAAMTNEIIGGICHVYVRLPNDDPEKVQEEIAEFRIRGKNPKDADVKAYIDQTVGPNFVNYAWAIAQKETYSAKHKQIYNQFNVANWTCPKTGRFVPAGTPNKDGKEDKDGWGIGQIDRSGDKPKGTTTTAEVWNWKVNVQTMAAKLNEKRDKHNEFIGYFKYTFGNSTPNPTTPYTHKGYQLPAEAWGTMVLYNGAGKTTHVPQTPVKTSPTKTLWIQSPWVFDGKKWKFFDNNNYYAEEVGKFLRGTMSIEEK